MRFIGNKENLISKIYDFMCERGVVNRQNMQSKSANNESMNPQSPHQKIFDKKIFDMFSGSASAGRFFKAQGFEVVSCDLLYFSYCLQMAYLANNTEPSFSALSAVLGNAKSQNLFDLPYQKIIAYLNGIAPQKGFIYRHYAPSGTKDLPQPRMYFSDENAQKIDAIRTQIEAWKAQNVINQNEYFILIATLLESTSFFANVAGVYAAFCKAWDKRALKSFALKPLTLLKSAKSHQCFCGNALEVLQSYDTTFDILYLDPPYNHLQYAPNYHLLETIARYDSPEIKGVAGLREWQGQKSNFCNAKSAIAELKQIIKSPNYRYLVLSYNSEGIMQKMQIDAILDSCAEVYFREITYPRFKSNAKSTQRFIKEFVWVAKRNP